MSCTVHADEGSVKNSTDGSSHCALADLKSAGGIKPWKVILCAAIIEEWSMHHQSVEKEVQLSGFK